MAHTTLYNDLDNFVKVEKDNFDWVLDIVEKETGSTCKIRSYPFDTDYHYYYNKEVKDENGNYIKVGLVHSVYNESLFYDDTDNNEYYINKNYVSEMRKVLATNKEGIK